MPSENYLCVYLQSQIKVIVFVFSSILNISSVNRARFKGVYCIGCSLFSVFRHRSINKHRDVLVCYNQKAFFLVEVGLRKPCYAKVFKTGGKSLGKYQMKYPFKFPTLSWGILT